MLLFVQQGPGCDPRGTDSKSCLYMPLPRLNKAHLHQLLSQQLPESHRLCVMPKTHGVWCFALPFLPRPVWCCRCLHLLEAQELSSSA